MDLLAQVLVFLSTACLAAGVWEIVRRRQERLRVALEAVRQLYPADPGTGGGRREAEQDQGRDFPLLLRWVQRRAEAAGVDIEPTTALWLVAAGAAVLWAAGVTLTGLAWVGAVAALGGLYAPVWWLGRQAARRAERVMRQLDQACQAIAQPMRAGASLFEALAAAAGELEPPLGSELRRIVTAVQLGGVPLRNAVSDLPKRIALDEVRLLVAAMRLHLETGADLPHILDGLSRTIKDRRETRAALLAATAPGRMQAKILVALPLAILLLIRAIYPEYLNPLFGTATGQVVFALSMAWLALGYRVMQRMLSTGEEAF